MGSLLDMSDMVGEEEDDRTDTFACLLHFSCVGLFFFEIL